MKFNSSTLHKKNRIFKLLLFIAFLCFGFLILYWELAYYGIQQGIGQFNILWSVRPKDEFLNNPNYPDSLKHKIRLISEIKKFAVDSLHINPSESYEKIFDQKEKPILWVVTACPRYALKAHKWTFPILGSFSYKGFFNHVMAKKERELLEKQHLDTHIGEVGAWSTLGYLNDPILSGMLHRPVGRLANLIIHELTHGTLYIKDNVTYNENLANFVGDFGAIRFLKYKYGSNSRELKAYENHKKDRDTFTRFILSTGRSLDTLYQSFTPDLTDLEKESRKKRHLKKIVQSIDTCHFTNKNYYHYFDNFIPNNTFFAGYARYNVHQNQFEKAFKTRFNSNFKKYLNHLKSKYSSL